MDSELAVRIKALLGSPSASNEELRAGLADLCERCRLQQQMLDRLTYISDKYQRAERDRGLSYAEQLQRKVRQVEKIVRISDGYQAMLQDLNTRLMNISSHDDLTGIPNRRHMQERLLQASAQSARTGEDFCIALLDIDFFKKINDTAGHLAGDAVLKRVASGLREHMRDYDTCGRWGGEEFLALFAHCDPATADLLAERLRLAIAEIDISDLHAELKLTVSIGYTKLRPGEDIDATLKRADDALYQAKAAGRNRVLRHP